VGYIDLVSVLGIGIAIGIVLRSPGIVLRDSEVWDSGFILKSHCHSELVEESEPAGPLFVYSDSSLRSE
jgi:hypothetical protein